MATEARIKSPAREGTVALFSRRGRLGEAPPAGGVRSRLSRLTPSAVPRLRSLLHAQSHIESRIVVLQWVVMLLVGSGAILPGRMGSGLDSAHSLLVLVLLALHPIAYLIAAGAGYTWLRGNQAARVATFTAIDIAVAIGVLFLTATRPGYTQVLLFSLVLLTATRYSAFRAISITTLVSVLMFFSIVASNATVQVTNLSSAILAMFAMTYGVNLLSEAERKEAAIAEENARLYRAVLLRNRELGTVNALSQAAAHDTDAERLFESGVELILSAIPAAWGQAYRYDRDTDNLELLFVRGSCRIDRDLDGAPAWSEALQAARTRNVVLGNNPASRAERGIRVSAPILVQGSTAGVIQATVRGEETDSTDDVSMQSLSIICQELGTSMEKALLRQAAQRSLVLEEKNRIAQELHDTVLQLLFSSNLGIEWCLQRLHEQPELVQKLGDIRRLNAQASNELRSSIFTLSSRIAEIGLARALEQLVSNFIEQYDLPVSLSTVGEPQDRCPVLLQNCVHRVVRESLMNAYKHAQASHIAVRVVFSTRQIVVVIHDDGVGIPTQVLERIADDTQHFGLRTVKRQVEELEGSFEIMNGEEGGTIIRAVMPLHPARDERG